MTRRFWALVTSEAIKLRRSPAVWLAVAAPGLLCLLELLTLFGRRHINNTDPARLWTDFLSFGWVMWLGLFLPALIGFEAISLAGLEHDGRHWKQLFALPIPRWSIFAVKMLACAALVAASFLGFVAGSVSAVLLFSGSRGLHLSHSIPWRQLAVTAFRAYLACWLIIAIHTWLSTRFRGFAVPAGIAFGGLLIGFLLIGANPDAFGWWYPWTLPINVRPQGLYDVVNPLAPALFGAGVGLALALPACWDLGRRLKDV
jgi:lantibiotic transport system permease protein